MPVFDRKEMEEKFDDENPSVEIPDDAEDDINNDWFLTAEEADAEIAAFNKPQESIWGGSRLIASVDYSRYDYCRAYLVS